MLTKSFATSTVFSRLFIQTFSEHFCGSWAATLEGKAAKDLLETNAWLRAGGLYTRPWAQLRSIAELADYSPDPRQPVEVIRFTMLWDPRALNCEFEFTSTRQDCMRMHFPRVHSELNVIDVEIFLCHGLTCGKLVGATLPYEQALKQAQKAPHRALLDCWMPIISS